MVACGDGRSADREPASPDPTPATAFTELAPDVYEPCGFTAAKSSVWVLGCSGNVLRISTRDGNRTERRLSGGISSLAALTREGDERVWALVTTGSGRALRGSVVAIDATSGEITTTIPLGSSIASHAVFAGGTLWVAAIDGRLFKGTASTAREVAKGVPLMWVLADEGRLWTIAENGDVTERNGSGSGLRTFKAVHPNPIAAGAGLGSIWLASAARGAVRIETATGEASSLRVTGTVNDFEECGGRMWISQPDSGLRALDQQGAVAGKVKLSVGSRYLHCTGDRLWIVSEDGRLGSIDPTG
jgi:hypothetical protein